jgi:hypothetical protein
MDTHLVVGFADEIPGMDGSAINTSSADLVAVG